MYQYVSATAKPRGKNQTWKPVDLSLVTLSALFNNYVDGHLVVVCPTLGLQNRYIDLNALRSASVRYLNISLEDWLSSVPDGQLPELSSLPTYTTSVAMYADAWQQRFKIRKVVSSHPDTPRLPDEHYDDLLIHKTYIDPTELQTKALVTVNGLLHRTEPYGEESILVKQGAMQPDPVAGNDVGVWSFVAIGALNQLPITPDMRVNFAGTDPTKMVYLSIGESLVNKSIMISLGGYLHVEDRVIDVISEENGIIRLDFTDMDWVTRYFEVRDRLAIPLYSQAESRNRPGALSVPNLRTIGFIEALLEHPLTFLIIVDTPHLCFETSPIGETTTPGVYEHPTEPIYPLRTQTGRISEYMRINQRGMWIMKTRLGNQKRYAHETGIREVLPVAHVTEDPNVPWMAKPQLFKLQSTHRV